MIDGDVPRLEARIETIELVCLEHLDIGFTASPQEIARRQKLHLDHALDVCTERPDFRWTIESVWQLEEWLARTPDLRERARLVALVKEGRVEIGAAFANLHTSLMTPALLLEAFAPGQRLARELGVEIHCAVQDDVPGFTRFLPTALAHHGVTSLLAGVNTTFGGGTTLAPGKNPFWWEAPDGSRVLTWVAPGSYVEAEAWGLGVWQKETEAEAEVAAKLAELEASGYRWPSVLVMASVGDNGDPDAARAIVRHVDVWNATHERPKVRFTTPSAFLAPFAARPEVETFRGDWGGHWEVVKASAPAATARFREAEALLLPAQVLSAQAVTDLGRPWPGHDLAVALRQLLLCAEHSQPGGVGWPGLTTRAEIEASNRFGFEQASGARETLRALITGAVDAFAARIAADGAALVVFNPSPFPRTDLVEANVAEATLSAPFRLVDAAGHEVPHEVDDAQRVVRFVANDLAPFALARYRFTPVAGESATAHPGAAPHAGALRIGNGLVAVEFDEPGPRVWLGDGGGGSAWLVPGTRGLVGLTPFDAGSRQVALPPATGATVAATTGVRAGPVTAELWTRWPGEPLAESRFRVIAGLPRIEWTVALDVAALARAGAIGNRSRIYAPLPLAEEFTPVGGDLNSVLQWTSPGGLLTRDAFLPGAVPGQICTIGGLRCGLDLLMREPFAAQLAPAWLGPPIQAQHGNVLFLLLADRALVGETKDVGSFRFERIEPTVDDRREFHLAIARSSAAPLADLADAWQLPLIAREHRPWFPTPAGAPPRVLLGAALPAGARLVALAPDHEDPGRARAVVLSVDGKVTSVELMLRR